MAFDLPPWLEWRFEDDHWLVVVRPDRDLESEELELELFFDFLPEFSCFDFPLRYLSRGVRGWRLLLPRLSESPESWIYS